MGYHTTEEEQAEMIRRYKSGETTQSIGEDMDFSDTGVSKVLERHGVDRREKSERHRHYEVNHYAFSEVTSDSAYWVGFIMADGCVYRRKEKSARLSVSLSEKDRGHLKKLRSFLDSDHPIYEGKNAAGYGEEETLYYSLQINSNQIASDLASFGVSSKKSETAEVNRLEDNRHFWRGVVDGDGYVRHGTGREAQCDLVGAKPVLKQYNRFCTNRIDSDLSVCPHKGIWKVSCSWGTAERLLNLLYQDGDTCLGRKEP